MYKNIIFILSSLFLLNNGDLLDESYSVSSSGSSSISPISTYSLINRIESSSVSPTTSCRYQSYSSTTDFSGTQGSNGWYYGYYNSGTFTQFTNYQTTSYTSSFAWNYHVNSNGFITSNIIMPNGANTCNTASYGNIAPVLRWYNPINSCYNDVTIYLSLSPGTSLVLPTLTVNGNSIYAPTSASVYSNYFNAYNVRSIELSVEPLNNNCDMGQTTYSLIISPMGSSNTVITSKSNTASNIPSISFAASRTITSTPKLSNSILVSPSNTLSATATATVFYLGNWTDFGQYNYAMADIVSYYDMTIYQCQLRCWLNPLCGLIVVESPCTTISLDSPAIYTTACNVCWLKLTSGWVVSASAGSKSIMLYDRVYPPTTSSRITYTPTASSIPTSSVVTYSTLNFCAISGKTITLPFIGSSTNIMTNAVGESYGNSISCNVYINGAGSSQGFQVNITNFNTEQCCDPFRIYNSVGTQVFSNSGILSPFNLYISGTSSIQFVFNTDVSAVGSGINAIVSLVYSSVSSSPSQTASISNSPNPSFSTIRSNSISSSSSQSKTSSASIDSTNSLRNSKTNTATASSSATVFYTGNWTDHGDVYFTGYIGITGSTTIHQCMITCWLDPLCGGISVNYACSDIDLDSPQIFSLLCANCRLIPKTSERDIYPGTFNQHPEWKSFIIYDKIFPPTTSVISSRTPTVSPIATSSIVTYSTLNFCSNSGKSITLPFVESSIYIMTNTINGQYINNLACSVNVYGAGSSQQFRINITSFNTEGCCDFFTVYNSNNNIIARYSGSVTSGTNFIVNGPFIRIIFTSDGSAIASGVFASITLEYSSSSASPSITSSSSLSKSSSYSPLPSSNSIRTMSNSLSPLTSKSSTNSISQSQSGLISKSSTNSISQSSSAFISKSSSNSILQSSSASISISSSNSISQSPSASVSVSSSNSISQSPSASISISSSVTYSTQPTISSKSTSTFSELSSLSQTPLTTPTYSSSPTYSPTPVNLLPFALPPKDSNYDKAVTNQLNNYLNDLLSNGGTLLPDQALSVINTIPQVGISDTLNVLKKLSGVVKEPISFSSTNFEGALAPIKNISVSVSSTLYNINVPVIPNLEPNSAIVAISWSNTTTFSNETTLSNIMSVSVSNKGSNTNIENLTTPIILSWNIKNITIPPNMTLKCSYWNYTDNSWHSDGCIVLSTSNDLIQCSCDHMTDFVTRFERIAEMNKNIFMNAGNVYSLDGLTRYRNYYIFYGVYFFIIIITAIFLQQLDIKNSKQYLLSLKDNFDILTFKKHIKKFYIDKCYLYNNHITDTNGITTQSSDTNDNMSTEENDNYNDYIKYINKISKKIYNNYENPFNYDEHEIKEIIKILVSDEISENKRNRELKKITKQEKNENSILLLIKLWWKRLLYQHNYFSIFFKYDPQSPRIYRIFFIFTLISHTLFMSALLYGYMNNTSINGSSVDPATPLETIVLSVITSLINVPVLNFAMSALLQAGKSEFAWRYPFIYREIQKIIIFEEEYSKIKNNKSSDTSINNEINNEDEGNIIINILTQYIFQGCFKKKDKITESNIDEIIIKRMDTELIKITDIPQKYRWYYSKYIPFHTLKSTITFFGCLGYLLWTINYLLLFSSNIQPSIQENILKSFGISQLFSIFLIHPITLLFTLLFSWLYNKYIAKSKNVYKPLYFYSDPFTTNKSMGLTTHLSKSLFVTSIALSSINQPTDDRIIAPAKGLVAQLSDLHLNQNSIDYYDKIILFKNKYSKY
jgi:hypothetical protein